MLSGYSDRNSRRSTALKRFGEWGLGLATVLSGTFAYWSTPALTDNGLRGIFGAAMVGFGTSLSAGAFALGGAALGAAGGTVSGTVIGGTARDAAAGAAIGALVGGLSGGVHGIPMGYGAAHDIVVRGFEQSVPELTLAVPENAQFSLAFPVARAL